MKTKTLLLICLFLGMGLTQLSAQDDQTGKTYSERYTASWSDPVFCDGILVDWLDCTWTVHHVAKFVHGEWIHCFTQSTGSAVSENTGETFTIKEIGKQDNNIQSTGEWDWVVDIHLNAKGNSGSHYEIFATLYWNGRVECLRSNCH